VIFRFPCFSLQSLFRGGRLNSSERKKESRSGAIILAGGDSKRLGSPKALLDFCGQSLIERIVERLKQSFDEITVVTDRPELYHGLPVRLMGDLLTEEQKSPLRGIHAGLSVSDLPYQFVVACDMPLLNLELIAYMSRFAAVYDAVVPKIDNYFQPLHAFYNRTCIGVIEEQVRKGCYKVTDLYSELKIRFISAAEIARFDPEQESFININTWPDYDRTLKVLAEKGEIDQLGRRKI
jgi:molybdenum cofactor guanylyltransferase